MRTWQNALVGVLLGLSITFSVVKQFVNSKWREIGKVEVTMLRKGLYVFNFETVESKNLVLDQSPWPWGSRMMYLRQWSPDLDLETTGFKSVPVWVHLPGLKLHYYTNEVLSKMMSFVGKPLYSDQHTAESMRPTKIPFMDENGNLKEQAIEYEWIPPCCDKCKCFGYNTKKCPVKMVDNWIPKEMQKNQNKELNGSEFE